MSRLDPPRLTRGPLSGRIYVVTHGKVTTGPGSSGELIEASAKYDVTDQFEALRSSEIQELALDLCDFVYEPELPEATRRVIDRIRLLAGWEGASWEPPECASDDLGAAA